MVTFSEKEFKELFPEKEALKDNGVSFFSKSKYKNKRVEYDGKSFDSIKEYERYQELLLKQKAGEITDLRYHDKNDRITLVDFPKVSYIPDFCYVENGENIVEDLKGMQTEAFVIKKKIVASLIYKKQLNCIFRLVKYSKKKGFHVIEVYALSDIEK